MAKKPRSDARAGEKPRSGKARHETGKSRNDADKAVTSFPATASPPLPAEAPPSIPLARGPSLPASAILADEDIALYYSKLPGWREHQGEHVLIHGGEVHGFFPTRDEARREGFGRFGHVAFLVKQVDLDAKPRPLVGVIL